MNEEGLKDDNQKLRWDLVPFEALEEIVKVYTYGAIKYASGGVRNWEKGLRWGRVFGAILRHLSAFWRGEENDPESGLPHLAHAAWNCLCLLHYSKYRKEFDDRLINQVKSRPSEEPESFHPSL